MRELTTFGALLRSFRVRLGEPRQRIEWLAERLTYRTSTVYGWENGDPSKGLPSRSTILTIGHLYSLRPDEVNSLISTCGAERKRLAHAAHYTPLSAEEIRAWAPLLAPMTPTVDTWYEQLRTAQATYRSGELRSARRLAESILRQLMLVTEGEGEPDLWSDMKREEIVRLWVFAWREYFESCALLETEATIAQVSRPFLLWTRKLVATAHDSRLKAMALHLEGDYYHNQALHTRALEHHHQALHELGAWKTDRALAAMIQRLIILDGVQTLTQEQLLEQVCKGRRMLEQPEPEDVPARVLLGEAIGRALGGLQNPDCWSVLLDAEGEARQKFPVGYITALYSRMLALASNANRSDPDQLQAIGTHALTIATYSDWQRRVEQIMQTANARGIKLRPLI